MEYSISHLQNAGVDFSKEWRCVIEQSRYLYPKPIDLLQINFRPYAFKDWRRHRPLLFASIAAFRVRRKILHGYTVRDCPIADRIEHNYGEKCSEIIINQVRHNAEKHVTNYPYPVNWWNRYVMLVDHNTIAIFRVKRRVNNG